jgi:ribose-phosphate pyrophosphokinase
MTIKINSKPIKSFNFSGGEVQVDIGKWVGYDKPWITVRADIHNSDGIMELLLAKDAIDRDYKLKNTKKTLVIPYLPYARQDRACNEGEALSIKVMANLINSMNFDHVITWDAHSDVGPALINNCVNVGPEEILAHFVSGLYEELEQGEIFLVSPDAGAEKKVMKVARYFGGLNIINAGKIRDVKTGEIVATKVDWGFSLRGKDLLIVDDICDGGRTFIELAKKLKRFKPQSINLYVTHGIFSKGYQPLFDANIKRIFTTNSFPQTETDGLKVVNI